jgi:isoquinoline 1-oxidoreductase subunit alpha
MATSFKLNGKPVTVDVDPATPILWTLRDNLGMTGTKFGCGAALCGACTVHLNGAAIRSCITPISAAAGADVRTIEAQEGDTVGKAVVDAWVKHDVAQCGYCQSGQVMSAVALLKSNKNPTDADIDGAMAGNICRCGTYQRIRAAIHDAARTLSA